MKRVTVLVVSLLLAGCGMLRTQPTTGNTAAAELRNAQGQVVGTANLTQVAAGVRIVLETKGLPAGQKAVHIHETGKCDAPQFNTAGGHYNPSNRRHGALNPQGSHAGDLPNIDIKPDGTGRLETLTEQVTLSAGPTTLFDADGSALVVHAAPDDFRTDPTGNAGARIACGVIVKR